MSTDIFEKNDLIFGIVPPQASDQSFIVKVQFFKNSSFKLYYIDP